MSMNIRKWLRRLRERNTRLLPPPDRSVLRSAEILDKQAQYIARLEKQG